MNFKSGVTDMRRFLFFALATVLLSFPSTSFSAQLINVTGNDVTLTYVDVDCAGQNEVGITVAGTGFVGQQISIQNCVAGGFTFNETAALTNSLAISVGADITIAADKTVTGLNNLFEQAAKAGDGTYSDAGSTTLWSAAYADRIDVASAIVGLHTGSTIVGGDALGILRLYGNGIDIGSFEKIKKRWLVPPLKILPVYYTVP